VPVDPKALPRDPDTLQKMLVDVTAQLDRTERLLRQLLQAKTGRKSEQLSREQLALFAAELGMASPEPEESHNDQDEDPRASPTGDSRGKPRGRKPLPRHLKRERIEHDLPEAEKHCTGCDQELRRIGEEVSERYQYIPAQMKVIEDACLKYACACTVKTAGKPAQPIEKSTADRAGRDWCSADFGDPAANTWADNLLNAFFSSPTFASCNQVFSKAILGYSATAFKNELTKVNFYIIGTRTPDSTLTQGQVTGNGQSTPLGSTLPLGTSADTLNSAWDRNVQSPAILVSQAQENFPNLSNTEAVLAHELLHAYLDVLDDAIFQVFKNYGLVKPKDGSTSAITNWIMTGCKSTPQ
jgi:zinc-finger binding domain of transposase IS66/Transposase C of IS166 homeodomain